MSQFHPLSPILEGFCKKNEAWVKQGAPCSQSDLPLSIWNLYLTLKTISIESTGKLTLENIGQSNDLEFFIWSKSTVTFFGLWLMSIIDCVRPNQLPVHIPYPSPGWFDSPILYWTCLPLPIRGRRCGFPGGWNSWGVTRALGQKQRW